MRARPRGLSDGFWFNGRGRRDRRWPPVVVDRTEEEAVPVPAATLTYVEGFSRSDVDACVGAFAPDGVYADTGTPEPEGRERLKARWSELFVAFPDLEVETVGLDPISDTVTVWRWVVRGTHRGPFRGMAATDREVVLPGCEFIAAGPAGIERVDGYYDRLSLLAQLGLAPNTANRG